MKRSFLPVVICLATSLIPAAAANKHNIIGTPTSSGYDEQQPDHELKQLLEPIH
jgi:hypothetical protein